MAKSYDDHYSRGKSYWGNKPHELVIKSVKMLPPKSNVLDLGSGEGQNSFYLARKRLCVTAVDSSKIGVEKTLAYAEKNKLKIDAVVSDINDYLDSSDKYDSVFCINVLQFMNKENIGSTIDKIKGKTKSGRLNVIVSFVADSKKRRKKMLDEGRYVFNKKELRAYYDDWEVLFYNEKWGKWEDHGKGRHRHYTVRLIAKKK